MRIIKCFECNGVFIMTYRSGFILDGLAMYTGEFLVIRVFIISNRVVIIVTIAVGVVFSALSVIYP